MRRFTVLFLLLASALALEAAAVALAGGSAAPTLSIKAVPRFESFNLVARITGVLRGRTGAQTVRLQSSASRNGHFVTTKEHTTSSTGSYSFNVKPGQNTFYRVVSGAALTTISPVAPLYRGYVTAATCNRCDHWHGAPAGSSTMTMYEKIRMPPHVNLDGRPLSFYLAANPSQKRATKVGTVILHQAAGSLVVRAQLTIQTPADLGTFIFTTCFPDRTRIDRMATPARQVPHCGTTRPRRG